MKKAMLRVLRVLAIGSLFALAGFLMSGCDGGADPDAGLVDVGGDVGAATCAIPSPTGDQPSGYGTARDIPPGQYLRVSNDVRAACETFKRVYPTIPKSVGAIADSVVAGIDCADPAHDFQGSSGMPWSVVVSAPDGVSACSGSPCVATGVAGMPRYQSSDPRERLLVRSWALCGAAGTFVGWAYTTS